MIDIVHRVGIRAPVSNVYAALATLDGLSGWWTGDVAGTCAPGGTLVFKFHLADGTLLGAIDIKVLALEENREVLWRCTGGADEWLGTDVVFKLSREGDYTIVRFGHRHWREAVEFTEHCSTKWATFLMSLKALVETGQGRPAPNDVLISDWH